MSGLNSPQNSIDLVATELRTETAESKQRTVSREGVVTTPTVTGEATGYTVIQGDVIDDTGKGCN